MFLIIEPVKQEEEFIDIEIFYMNFFSGPGDGIYRKVFETEQNIYICSDFNSVNLWLRKYFSPDFIEINFPDIESVEQLVFEFWFITREFRLIRYDKREMEE